jgi:two-component system phosphate regulon sensor histidine kinase PhoR
VPRFRFLWKLYITYVAMIGVTTLTVGVLASKQVADDTRREIRSELETAARLVAAITGPDFGERRDALKTRLESLSAVGIRVTLIDAAGTVIADSEEDPPVMDPHGTRPEVLEARSHGVGVSSRVSRTLDQEQLYVAVRIGEPGRVVGYVRTSVPLVEVRERLARIREIVFLGAVIAAAAGLLLGYPLARRLTRSVRRLSGAVRDIATGDYDRWILIDDKDELGDVSRSFNIMAEQLRLRVDEITRERNQLLTILGGMVEGVVAVDGEDRVLHINQVAKSILGVVGECVGKPIWQATRAHDLSEVVTQCREEGLGVSREIEITDGGGKRVVDLSASPLTRGDGTPIGVVLVLHDITNLRRLQVVRQDFVANASHELKTPIAAIRGLVETILDDQALSEAKRRGFLERIRGQSVRLTSLVSDLLTISRVESGGVATHASSDLAAVVAEAHRAFEPPAQVKNVTLILRTPDHPVKTAARTEDLRQIVNNLVDNAIKYTPPGGTVELLVAQEGREIGLLVRDTGPGIEKQHQDRIFERFYRVDAARSRELGGTGLGLAIVKNLVQSLGGRVWVESEPGAGSGFYVRLPGASPDES